MKKVFSKSLLVTAMCLPFSVGTAWADDEQMAERITRLERIVKGQGLVSLLGRVDQLQSEVQRLNGDNEALRHQLEMMKRRQREMYIDLDGRLQSQAVAPTTMPNTSVPSPVVSETVDVPSADVTVIDRSVTAPETTAPSVPTTTPAAAPASAPATPTLDAPVSPVAVENGEAAYQAALQTLRSGQYEDAITALAAFPERYPQSSYLPNAYYWQGEANYVLRNFDLAIAAFQTVIEQFPVSSKVPDAMLKQGFSQYELGQTEQALANLNQVIEQYPNTSAARLAKVRLERIQKESR